MRVFRLLYTYTIDFVARMVALTLIKLYQVSWGKLLDWLGYPCAYYERHGGVGCSRYGFEMFRTHTFLEAFRLTWCRLQHCDHIRANNEPVQYWTFDTFDENATDSDTAALYRRLVQHVLSLDERHISKSRSVCPWAMPALNTGRMYFVPATMYAKLDYHAVAALVQQCIDLLRKHDADSQVLQSLIMFFPEDFPLETLFSVDWFYSDRIQREGYVLGTMFPAHRSLEPSAYPYGTPIPTLIIRAVTPNDVFSADFVDAYTVKWLPGKILMLRRYFRNMRRRGVDFGRKDVRHATHLWRECWRKVAYGAVIIGSAIAVGGRILL